VCLSSFSARWLAAGISPTQEEEEEEEEEENVWLFSYSFFLFRHPLRWLICSTRKGHEKLYHHHQCAVHIVSAGYTVYMVRFRY
jgi:hypothetical protein